MSLNPSEYQKAYEEALQIGRPPNIKTLFTNSRALLVSGKFIDRAMLAKGQAIAMAANARNSFVVRGALAAAQRANAAIIIEIAKSESDYCMINYWNIARYVDTICNELNITVPVAVHADHYGIKTPGDIESAKTVIPSIFDAGITSTSIDASHLPDADNLTASIELYRYVPEWSGFETEVGEIKGDSGLSTPEEALFLIRGLNAHGIFPDWIALNNGTTHGIESRSEGIQTELTAQIHEALSPYNVSGAQHGTSGNSSEKLNEIRKKTRTTKANVATALQMLAWGLKVNDYGNAHLDENGDFVKLEGEGMTGASWEKLKAYAGEKGLRKGDYKKLNLPFENLLLSQERSVRERMCKRVEDFTYDMLVNVFNCNDTAPIVLADILEAGAHDPGSRAGRIENPDEWTFEKIRTKGGQIVRDRGPEGDFDD